MYVEYCYNLTMKDEIYKGNQIGGTYSGAGMTYILTNTNLSISNFTYTNNIVTSKEIGLIQIGIQIIDSPLVIEGFTIENNECDASCDSGLVYINSG